MFKYPNHFKLPEPGDGVICENFHAQWTGKWEYILRNIINKPDAVGIEIGSLYGCSAVHSLERILTGTGSYLYCIDINYTDTLKHNLEPYSNVKVIQGLSSDVLKTLSHNNLTKSFADYVYIDGSHLAKDVLVDAVLSFDLLKPNGIMIFDDYWWGIHTKDETQKPKLGIDCFLNGFHKYYEILDAADFPRWQVYIQKIDYKLGYEEAKANYQLDGGKL